MRLFGLTQAQWRALREEISGHAIPMESVPPPAHPDDCWARSISGFSMREAAAVRDYAVERGYIQ